MNLVDALLPPTLARCARRLSTLCITLAFLVAFLMPASSVAGTEVMADRVTTAALLFVAGVGLRLFAKQPRAVLGILVGLGALEAWIGALWLAAFAAGGLVYAAISSVRGRAYADVAGEPGATGDAGEATDDTEKAPEVVGADLVRENVEAIAMALVLALTVREFAYEAFQIPTGSMKPTIHGRQHDGGFGDRLLASKVSLALADPPRWSIVVFHYPLLREVNYIKRLVGLPGEAMEIRRGDIYVNGEIVSKPDAVQESLWFPLFPRAETPYAPEESSLAGAFAAADGGEHWTLKDETAAADVPPGSVAWLGYDEYIAEPDLRVSLRADVSRVDEDSALLLRVEGALRSVELAVTPDGLRATMPQIEWTHPDAARLETGPLDIGLGVADRVLRVYRDGRVVARIQHPDVTNDGPDRPRLSIGVRGAALTLSRIRVDHDLQYVASGKHEFQIPEDHFVMLGDNTTSSNDSRMWKAHEVTTSDGREFIVEDMRLTEENGRVKNFRRQDGRYEFFDSYGVRRSLPEEVVVGSPVRSRPYVHRSDLIGRAFLIFFPFPPSSDEFRPRLLP